jgi:hypothetical protein
MRTVANTVDCLAYDTNTPLTSALVRAISLSTFEGESPRAISRYVSLHRPNPGYDISAEELAAIIDPANDLAQGTGLGCWLVQHVRYGVGSVQSPDGWTPSGQLGSADGIVARKHASIVGYPTGAHLEMDLEGVNPATLPDSVSAHCEQWALAVSQEAADTTSYPAMLYDGYSPGLSPEQLWEVPSVHLYEAAPGARPIPNRGFIATQVKLDVVIAGVKVDVVRVRAMDDRGGRLVWCVA